MNGRIYDLDETDPVCPSCGKKLEDALVARDFVVCVVGGLPRGEASSDRCGWCNKWYTATPKDGKIIFTIGRE